MLRIVWALSVACTLVGMRPRHLAMIHHVLPPVNGTALVATNNCCNEFWPPWPALVAAVAFGQRSYFGFRGLFQDDLASVVEAVCSKDSDKLQSHAYINTQTYMVVTISCNEEDRCGRTVGRESTCGSISSAWWKATGCREATEV